MRNHTATHLLHAELRTVLGEHARQAGSLVAPDRLRFDFTHPQAVTAEQLEQIEAGVNRAILGDYPLNIAIKPLQQAIGEGAMALFGEKYGEIVRTHHHRRGREPFSNELCGGTHVDETGDIGLFLITSEGSAAAGIRRIEAVTGRGAYELVQRRFRVLKQAADLLSAPQEDVPVKIQDLMADLGEARKKIAGLKQMQAQNAMIRHLDVAAEVKGVPVLTATLDDADAETLRDDRPLPPALPKRGCRAGLRSADGRPALVASVSEDLVKRGLHAGELVKHLAAPLGGSGGGRPTLAQAGGKDAAHLEQALASVTGWVEAHLVG